MTCSFSKADISLSPNIEMGFFSQKVKDQEKVPVSEGSETGGGIVKKAVVFDDEEKTEATKKGKGKDGKDIVSKKDSVPAASKQKESKISVIPTKPATPKKDSKKKEGPAATITTAGKTDAKDEKSPSYIIAIGATNVPEKGKQRTKSSQPGTLSKKEVISSDEKRSRSKSEGSTDRMKADPAGKNEEKEVMKTIKPAPKVKTPETILNKPEESRIPTRHAKKPIIDSAKRIEHTLQQMGTLKTRLKHELKTRPNKQIAEELNMDNFDFSDTAVIKEKLMEMHKNNCLLRKQVSELNSHNSTLQNRLLKEQEKGKLHPKVTTVVPTSLEANMHLRYQFQKNLEKERKKYAQLLLENERLALEVKEANLENLKKRKTKTMETSIAHNNEITNWKVKVRELELDNLQLLEIITKREQEMAKVVKEKEFIYNEMVTMRRLHMHLSNRIDTMATSDGNSSSGSQEVFKEKEVENSTAKTIISEVPHYAQTVKRENELKLRAGNKKLLESKRKTSMPSSNKKIDNQTLTRLKPQADPVAQAKTTTNTIDSIMKQPPQPPVLVAPQVEKVSFPDAKKVNKETTKQRNETDLSILGEQKPVTPVLKSRSRSETPSKPSTSSNKDHAIDEEKENGNSTRARNRAASEQPTNDVRKAEQMKNAKIQLEYESYVPTQVKNQATVKESKVKTPLLDEYLD